MREGQPDKMVVSYLMCPGQCWEGKVRLQEEEVVAPGLLFLQIQGVQILQAYSWVGERERACQKFHFLEILKKYYFSPLLDQTIEPFHHCDGLANSAITGPRIETKRTTRRLLSPHSATN